LIDRPLTVFLPLHHSLLFLLILLIRTATATFVTSSHNSHPRQAGRDSPTACPPTRLPVCPAMSKAARGQPARHPRGLPASILVGQVCRVAKREGAAAVHAGVAVGLPPGGRAPGSRHHLPPAALSSLYSNGRASAGTVGRTMVEWTCSRPPRVNKLARSALAEAEVLKDTQAVAPLPARASSIFFHRQGPRTASEGAR